MSRDSSIPTRRRLYELIWKRTIASQMASGRARAHHRRHRRRAASRRSAAARHRLGDRASTASSPSTRGGPRRRRGRGRGRPPAADDAARRAPVEREQIVADQHFTEPPPRYSEATLVKKLEELGIGRPSTYASILKTLRDREYVRLDKRRFVPEDKGRLRHRLPRELLRALRRIRFHRRSRGEARRDLRRRARLEGRAARFLAGFRRQASHGSKELRVPTCSTR